MMLHTQQEDTSSLLKVWILVVEVADTDSTFEIEVMPLIDFGVNPIQLNQLAELCKLVKAATLPRTRCMLDVEINGCQGER